LTARYSHADRLRGYRSELTARGFAVTSRWINGDQARAPGESEAAAQARFAREDLEDIDRCGILIAFTEEPRTVLTCGGRHFEAGVAHALGKRVLIVGPRENIFYQIADAWFETWDACLASLDQSAIRRST
jgi:nucleoside 2-deoxyribosyltransferase